MCDVTYATLALTAAATAVQYQEGNKAAARQQQAIEDGLAKDQAATNRLYEQINDSAKDEQAVRHTEHLIDQARLKAIYGESGLSGSTYDRIDQEEANNASTDMATIEKNRQAKAVNASSQSLARSTQAGIQMAGIRRPSAIGTGLQIATDTANYFKPPKAPR